MIYKGFLFLTCCVINWVLCGVAPVSAPLVGYPNQPRTGHVPALATHRLILMTGTVANGDARRWADLAQPLGVIFILRMAQARTIAKVLTRVGFGEATICHR